MVKFIADVGSNFNGSKELAKNYVNLCKSIGVDIVKFQCWNVDDLFSEFHPAYESLKKKGVPLGLPLNWHRELKLEADRVGITFSTTPTQPYQIEELEEIGIEVYKVASGDLTFFPLLEEINKTRKDVIISTGMANLSEIEMAITRLLNCRSITILHCVSLYPPDYSEVNLKAIETLKRVFPDCSVGLSDHSLGMDVCLAAVPMGVSYIEKHITLDKNLGTPDASFSLTVEEFKRLIEKVKNLELALGSGVKQPEKREWPERFWARRGMYANRNLKMGEIISVDKVKFLRPCKGIPVEAFESVLGMKLKRDIHFGEPIFFEDLE